MKHRKPFSRKLPRKRPQLRMEVLERRLFLDASGLAEPVSNEPCPYHIEQRYEQINTGPVDLVLEGDCFIETTTANQSTNEPNTTSEESQTITIDPVESPEELQQFLLTYAIEQWKDLFGKPRFTYWQDVFTDVATEYQLSYDQIGAVARSAVSFLSNAAYSTESTNVQVSGVDEGDIVKTDGEYLYIATQDRRLAIVDVRDPADMKVVYRAEFENFPREIYVTDDRLIVISNSAEVRTLVTANVPFFGDLVYWPDHEPEFEVSVFDITEPSAPTLISTNTFEGTLLESRAVGDVVYLVTSKGIDVPRVQVHCENDEEDSSEDANSDLPQWLSDLRIVDPSGQPTLNCVYETEEEYTARVADTLLERFIPDVTTTSADGTSATRDLVAIDDVYINRATPWQLMSTVVLDTADDTSITASAGVLSSYGTHVYATEENVYVASPAGNGLDDTQILQFVIGADGTSVDLGAHGIVTGHLQNQFAMDEHNGQLRITTTNGWGENASNNLFVLEAEDGVFEIIGSITGIAPGETLLGSRFLGDTAFLTTFERIDPVFAIDLSDPTNPQIKDELEVRGFSTYLHPGPDGYLIGFGRDVVPENGNGMDPQISLFDVRDLTAIELVDRFVVDTDQWTWSPADSTHHAINFYPDLGVLTIPFHDPNDGFRGPIVNLADDTGGLLSHEFFANDEVYNAIERLPEAVDDVITHVMPNLAGRVWRDLNSVREHHEDRQRRKDVSGLWVFKIDPDAADPISSLGKITHRTPVERSVRIGDVLFAISHGTVTSHKVLDPAEKLDEVSIAQVVFDDQFLVEQRGEPKPLDVLKNDHVDSAAKIISVSVPENGGTAEISEDGRSVIYAPPSPPEVTIVGTLFSSAIGFVEPHSGAFIKVGENRYELALVQNDTELLRSLHGQTVEISGKVLSIVGEFGESLVIQVNSVRPVDEIPAENPSEADLRRLVQSRDSFRYTVQLADGATEEGTTNIRLVSRGVGDYQARLAKQYLAGHLRISPLEIRVVSVEPRLQPVCNSSSSDCIYDPGFTVVLQAGDKHYTIHTDLNARFLLVDQGSEGVNPDSFRVAFNSTETRLDVLANDFPNVEFIRAPQITAVSETRAGGRVTIANNGSMLLYTPPKDFVGEDSFTYTVDNGPTGRVVVHVVREANDGLPSEPAILVGTDLTITDSEGNSITRVEVGDIFYVNIFVDDLRRDGSGVYGAYFDLEFNSQVAEVNGEVEYGEHYINGKSGEVKDGLIDELGAFTNSMSPLGGESQLLVRVPFESIADGEVRFALKPTGNNPIHGITLFGINQLINDERVRLDRETIHAVNGWHNEAEPADVNNDQVVTPMDVLALINYINEGGSGRLGERMRTFATTAERESFVATRKFYDVNRDGFLTPLDPLFVINRLNSDTARTAQQAAGESSSNRNSDTVLVYGPEPTLRPQSVLPSSLGRAEGESSGSGSAILIGPLPAHEVRGERESLQSAEFEELLDEVANSLEPRSSHDCVFAALGD